MESGCLKCSELRQEYLGKRGRPPRCGDCKIICRKQTIKKYRERLKKNKIAIIKRREYARKYYNKLKELNPDLLKKRRDQGNEANKEYRSKYYKDRRPFYRAKYDPEHAAEVRKRRADNLNDTYIKELITTSRGARLIPFSEIPKELIEIKRTQIRLLRHAKENAKNS